MKLSYLISKQRLYYVGCMMVAGWLLSSCSQYSTGRLSVGYHNLTAKYNAYIIAREKLREAEETLQKNHKEDYNQLLPILPKIDSVEARSVGALLDDVIKKASLIPNRHQNSKWVDNALVILGKARLYKGQNTEAIETLRYVNAKGTDDDDKHEALVWLMRAYVETKDYNSALSVAEYLRSQPLNAENTRNYYLVKALLHQQKQEYPLSLGILEETFKLLPKNATTARIHFAAAQMYDLLEKPQAANYHYEVVDKNRATYDMSFYARMSNLQNEAITNPNVSIEGGFRRLLNDRKNTDLRDKLYYSMGVIETRKKNYRKALNLFNESIKQTTTNTSQVPYTYLEMARVYYDKLQNYELAKAYFDSSLTLLPKDSPQYQKIVDKKDVLDDFVKYYQVVRTEDSLQRLSQMNPATLDKYLDTVIEKEIDAQQKKIEEAKKLVEQARMKSVNQISDFDGNPAERFALYNGIEVERGRNEFIQRWGNRKIEDDWRRSTKVAALVTQSDNNTIAVAKPPIQSSTIEFGGDLAKLTKDSPEWKARKDALYRNIPLQKQELDASNQRVEEALYKLGKIYKFSLDEPQNAIKTFEDALARFPSSNYKPEIYYLLYLTSTTNAQQWKDKLLAEFPTSSYTRMLTKANGAMAASGNLEIEALKDYEKIFNIYQSGNFTEAYAQLEMAILTYAGTKIEDKYAVLRIYLVGKLQGKEAYLKAINDFVKDYPNSSYLPRMRELLESQQATSAKKNG